MNKKFAFLVCWFAFLLTACSPGPGGTTLEPPVAEATAVPAPRFSPVQNIGDPIVRDLPSTEEIVPNCSGGGGTVAKHPGLTSVSGHSVEWEIGGEFGAGVTIGEPYLPVTVDLRAVLDVADRTKLEQNLQQSVVWDLPAEPGEIIVYTLGWQELWQTGYIDVTFGDQTIRRVNVTYRTGIRSDIIDERKQNCDGSQPSPTAAPESTLSPIDPLTSPPPPTESAAIEPELTAPIREHFDVFVGTGIFENGTFSDGQAPYTEQWLWDNGHFDIQRIRREEYPNGCDVSRYNTDRIWIGGTPGMRITINGQEIGQYTIVPNAHGYMFAWSIRMGDEICAVDVGLEGFHIILGPDVYYQYDSYCSRGLC